jgi:SAM-dependent methyltransferase
MTGMKNMRRFVVPAVSLLVRWIPASLFESLIPLLWRARVRSLTPPQGLRMLLQLDSNLYSATSDLAVRYGNGVHPKHRHMRYHDFFVERIRADERALDVGCGIGAVAFDVAERSRARVVGIDIEPAKIAAARRRFAHPLVEYRVGDALQELPGQPFDAVILSNVLEHLPERPDFLRRLVKAVTPLRLLIRVPLFERDWRVPVKKEVGLDWRLDETHETEYTLESFAEEMAASDLKIVEQQVRWGEIWAVVVPGH